jgi:hypothetical protein
MEQINGESDTCLACQVIPRPLLCWKFLYRIQENALPDSILSQINPVNYTGWAYTAINQM